MGVVEQQAMRNGQQHHHNKRMRGRNNNNQHNNNNNRRNHNPLTRVYESNGPDVKIRGTANHVAEKYLQLARDAQSSGDPVSAENYFQHAEHYFRLIAAAQEQFRQQNPNFQPRQEGGGNDQQFQSRQDENFEDGGDDNSGQQFGEAPFSAREPQPYVPQNAQPFPQQRDNQNYQPREQRDQARGERDSSQPQEIRQDVRSEQQPRHHQPRHQPQPQPDHGNVDALPAFITGGAPQPQAEQNGFENGAQGDRFPLHRRRRRHRGPRSEGGSGDRPEPAGGE
jgi:hypothetical protein